MIIENNNTHPSFCGILLEASMENSCLSLASCVYIDV